MRTETKDETHKRTQVVQEAKTIFAIYCQLHIEIVFDAPEVELLSYCVG